MIDELEVARREVELCNINTSRGSIAPDGSGYVVNLDRPLVDIARHIEGETPKVVHCRTAYQAELSMLTWLRRIQQAERRQVRMGRWHEGITELVKRPLDPGEVAEYLAEQAHRKQVDKLRAELADALQRKQEKRDAQRQAERLAERYPGRLETVQQAEPRRPGRPRKTEQQLPLTGVATEE